MHISVTAILSALLLANVGLAVDCSNRSYTSCEDKTVHYYDLDTGEVCPVLDCGGGRAPPKTNNPCCGSYTGTEPCVPPAKSTLSCFKQSTSAAAATTTAAGQSSSAANTGPGSGSGSPVPTQTGSSTTGGAASGGQTTQAPTTGITSAAATSSTSTGAGAKQGSQALGAVVGVAVGVVLVL